MSLSKETSSGHNCK